MCVAFERKENDFWELNNWYIHMIQPLKMAKFTTEVKNQDLHDLFVETLFWINLCPAKN